MAPRAETPICLGSNPSAATIPPPPGRIHHASNRQGRHALGGGNLLEIVMTQKVMRFNPYTGQPRDPRDIASDPEGLLLIEPGKELLAAVIGLHRDLRRLSRPIYPPEALESLSR